MYAPLQISTITLNPTDAPGLQFDMTSRCAFAICTQGEFEIKILNMQYHVTEHCMFACMPFVNIDVISIPQESKVIFGYIQIEDVQKMIKRWVNTSNLLAIQNRPVVKITAPQFYRLKTLITQFISEYSDNMHCLNDSIYNQLHRDIIDFQSRLIVAQVLKLYFENIPMEMSDHTHRDIVYQRFMFSLYGNFRDHRDVYFYAMRSGVSLKYFSTIIKQLSGSSPSQWIETIVVGEAKSMLNDPNTSIKDIATELNFPDAPTFSKYFHRITGMTPKAYRKTTLQ